MSISNNYVPLRQLGNGVTTQFSASWSPLVASYLKVYLESVSTGVQTLQTLGTHYTLTFNSGGFTVTFLSAPTSSNYVVIGRSVALDQTDPYKTTRGFQGETLESSLDKLTAITQDLYEQASRSAKFPLGSTKVGVFPGTPVDDACLAWSGVDGAIKNGPTTASISANAAAAAASASAAASSASSASSSATAASGSATAAAGSASAASTSASNAASSASAASTSASNASTSATNAASSASTATTQASNASSSASAASTSASNASTSATNAGNSATAAAGSAASAAAYAVSNRWTFSSTVTMADPGSGVLRLNNATISSATQIAIAETNADSANLAAWLLAFDDATAAVRGYLSIRKDATNFAIFGITGGTTDNGTWDTLSVTYVAGAGSFTNGDSLYLGFAQSGNNGAGTGDASTNTATSVDGEGAVFSGTGGKTLKRFTGTGLVRATSGVLAAGATVALTEMAAQAANTFVANATASSAAPTAAVALSASQLAGRGATGNLAAITLGTNLSMSGTTLNAAGGTSVVTVKKQVFTSSGTYTPSTGMIACLVRALAGGGNGGSAGANGSGGAGGGGGGAGSYSESLILAATIGASQTVTIGAGGGATSLGTLVTTNGGSNGGNGAGGTSGTPGNGGAGGAAGTGDIAIAGAPGGCGPGGSGGGALTCGGHGGSNVFGGGGVATTSAAGGSATTNSGSGGAGGGNGNSGGSGAAGIMHIIEFCSQ